MTSLLALCIVLPFDYFQNKEADRGIAQRIQTLKQGVDNVIKKEIIEETDLPQFLSSDSENPDPEALKEIFGGLSFFEKHEIDHFLIKKFQDADEIPELYPPLDLVCLPEENGVELKWSHNVKNEALIKKLANNPLLRLNYKVYRWISGHEDDPEVIQTLTCDQDSFTDQTISSTETQYFYCVMAAFEGVVGQHNTIIETRASNVRTLRIKDRFDLKILNGDPSKVSVKITVKKNGVLRSHVFTVKEGEFIGREQKFSGIGAINFSTHLKLRKILTEEVEEEVLVKRPVFNPDASRKLDPFTGDPIFLEQTKLMMVSKLTLECEDSLGNVRIVKEN